MNTSKSVLTCVGLLLTSCATLKVKPLDSSGPNVGIGYVLPFTQYAVTTSWRLDYCPDPDNPKPGGRDNPALAVKIDLAAGSADDGDLAYIVNPQDLQTLTSVTTFTAKWQDGRNLLASIGASVDDHSAQVVGNLVKSAITIVKLAAGVPGPLAPPGAAPPPAPLCLQKSRNALVAAQSAKGALQVRTKAVEAATEVLKTVSAKVATMGTAVSDKAKQELDDAVTALDAATTAQDDAAATLAEALKPLTYTRKILWPSTGNEFSHGPVALDSKAAKEWFNEAALALTDKQNLYLQIERTGSFGRQPSYLESSSNNPKSSPADVPNPHPITKVSGLPYRMSATGRLVICSISPCKGEEMATVLASLDGPIAQLGYVNILPFRSRAFGSNSFNAEFALDGSLKSAGYEQKVAPAESVTGAMLDTVTQVASAIDPTAKLTVRNAYLKQLKEQQDNLIALQPKTADAGAAVSALDADTALTNAKLANIKASIALADAEKSINR